jgi:hypothetical protein
VYLLSCQIRQARSRIFLRRGLACYGSRMAPETAEETKARMARVRALKPKVKYVGVRPRNLIAKTDLGEAVTAEEIEQVILRKALRDVGSHNRKISGEALATLERIYARKMGASGAVRGPGRPRAAKEAPPSTLGLSPEPERAPYESKPPGPVAPIAWTPPAD